MIIKIKNKYLKLFQHKNNDPVLGNSSSGGPENSTYTFIAIVRRGFDINIPNANSTIRLGFCKGFEQLGVKYKLMDVFNLEYEVEHFSNPIIFLSLYDYLDMTRSCRKKLRNYYHIVWGSPNYGILQKIYSEYGFSYKEDFRKSIYKAVGDSHPSFIWAPVPQSALVHYTNWHNYGCRIESLPLACDTTRYYPANNSHYDCMNELAFVGGYWPKKAIQFEKYLRPFESKLMVYGNSIWPYSGYKGLLKNEDERILYCNSKVSPAISEPHAQYTGDIVERVFKILGSGGLAVPDVNKYYRELFSDQELFMPETISEYSDFVNEVLHNKELNIQYRLKGYNAVMQKHTYKERAKTIFDLLNLKLV